MSHSAGGTRRTAADSASAAEAVAYDASNKTFAIKQRGINLVGQQERHGRHIDANFAAARSAMNLSGQQIATLARNSFEACFTTEEQRDRWMTELDARRHTKPQRRAPEPSTSRPDERRTMVNDTQPGTGLSAGQRQQIREKVMAQLRPYAFPDTRFIYDISQFLPAYVGYESLTDTLPALPFWAGSGTVYSTPDNCLELVRSQLIADRRPLLQTIAVRLGFRYFAPGSVLPGFEQLAGTLDGAALLSAPVDLAEVRDLGQLDFVITGCRAVTRQGVRFGKGYGYFDLEWGILSELGIVTDATPAVVVCHDVQVLDMDLPPSPVDTLVDWIVTPTETIEVKRTRPKPLGIQWDRVQPRQWDSTPVLTELKAMS